MQQDYQSFHQRAQDLQYRVHDVLGDNQYEPMAMALRNEVKGLSDDLELHKNPRDIENRIQTIQRSLMEAQNSGSDIISVDHSVALHRDYEHMRMDARRLPGY